MQAQVYKALVHRAAPLVCYQEPFHPPMNEHAADETHMALPQLTASQPPETGGRPSGPAQPKLPQRIISK